MFMRKDVVFHTAPDLCDPYIETDMSVWIWRAGVHGVSRDAYDPWRAP
jgi:hypothetical protein